MGVSLSSVKSNLEEAGFLEIDQMPFCCTESGRLAVSAFQPGSVDVTSIRVAQMHRLSISKGRGFRAGLFLVACCAT